jgi:hypothetical protein
MEARGPIAARSQCPHWDLEIVSLKINGSKITSNMKQKLQSQLHFGDLMDYLLEREEWTDVTFDKIA